MTKKIDKQTRLAYFKEIFSIFRILLAVSILINVGILILIPHHFSFISGIIVLSCLYMLLTPRQRAFKFSAAVSIVLSLLYATLIYYWVNKGPYGCGEFFGEYSPCLESFQYTLLEIVVTPVAFLLVSLPLIVTASSKYKKT